MRAPYYALCVPDVRLASRLLALLYLLFCMHSALASTQPETLGHYQYATWSVEAGLPQVTVTSMARGADGRMWLGTQNGLARLDGQDIEVFKVDEFPELGSNWIKHLLVTDSGDLWLSTLKQLVLWRDGKFKVIATREQLGEVTALSVDSMGKLWVAADRLWYFDGAALALSDQWSGSVRAMVASANVWVASDKNTIHQLGKPALEALIWPETPMVVRQMAMIKQRLWVATHQGLYRSNGQQLERVTQKPIIAMTAYADELWFADESGVFCWRGDQIEAQLLATSAASLTLVTKIFVDENKAFWLGSQAQGARYYWRAPYVQISKDDGLTEFSWSIFADKKGLLVGTNHGVFLGENSRFKNVVKATHIPGGVGYALLRDSADRLWVGAREGLAVQENDKWRDIAELQGEQVNSLLETQGGDILIGAARGLYRSADLAVKALDGAEELLGRSVRTLLEDDKQNLWIGTENGLSRWTSGELFNETFPPLNQDFIPALLQLQDGRIVAATYQSGIFIKSLASGWKPLVLTSGVPTQGAFGLFEYDGWLWISNGDGIQRIPVSQLEIPNPALHVVYFDAGVELGRSALRCCNGGGNGRAVTSEGFAWFASLGGVVRVDLSLPETKVPVAKISQVLNAEESPNSKVKDVEIHYSVLDYRRSQQLAYRYRMKPYNLQWQDAGDRRIAYYTNLPPGDLTFEVQAKQAFGNWGPTASVSIVVSPLYYETLWFKILLVLLVLVAGYGAFRIRTFNLRLRGQLLDQEIQSRTAQLEQMNTELERVNSELHLASITDPLTGLHNRRFMTEQIGFLLARMKRQRVDEHNGLVLGFFLIDLDWFKHINDRYGHGVGDTLLIEVAAQFKKACRESDMLLRWGGEEFLLLAPECDPAEFSNIAERLRGAVVSAGEKIGLPQNVSASVGCVPHPLSGVSDIQNWTFTLALADYCLYQAKAAGRNCSVTATIDEALLSTYKEIKITSTELETWQKENRLKITLLSEAK